MRQGNGNKFTPETTPALANGKCLSNRRPPRDANSVTAAGLWASNSRNTLIWLEWIQLGTRRVVMATRPVTVMEYYFYFGQAHALATPKGGGPCPLGTLYYLVVGHLDS